MRSTKNHMWPLPMYRLSLRIITKYYSKKKIDICIYLKTCGVMYFNIGFQYLFVRFGTTSIRNGHIKCVTNLQENRQCFSSSFRACSPAKLTISPFGSNGGSHDTIIFELDAGIALISCGADGTAIEFNTINI